MKDKTLLNKQYPMLSEAIDFVGELIELSDDDIKYYHENIKLNSKELDGNYFD